MTYILFLYLLTLILIEISVNFVTFFSDQMGINSPKQVELFRDKAVHELKEYCCSNKTEEGETRFSRLLLSLSPLRSIQPDVLEELFFAGLIGNVQIDSVVPYILKMESSEYQSQFGGGNKLFQCCFESVVRLYSVVLLSYGEFGDMYECRNKS